jgi:hypothetical protein
MILHEQHMQILRRAASIWADRLCVHHRSP